mmetsp:Transcript_1192/g.1585  ORF Transcript_1192/g.1585 Transcript_1192/m.1585 type:complete len:100 (-) Transcript_1192:6592-6891(-)
MLFPTKKLGGEEGVNLANVTSRKMCSLIMRGICCGSHFYSSTSMVTSFHPHDQHCTHIIGEECMTIYYILREICKTLSFPLLEVDFRMHEKVKTENIRS